MKYENEFDFNGFNKEAVLNVVNKGDDLFQEKFEENGILLCKMDKADVLDFESTHGQSVVEAAKKLIMLYSTDGTIESGLQVLADKSKKHDGPDYVGYLLITEMRKSND